MNIQIHAADTLFFRDGKPFAMGEETWANGMFPDIAPGVLLGALRSLFAAQKGLDKNDIEQATQDASIVEYALCLGNEIAFPIPFDLIGDKKNEKAVKLKKEPNVASSNPSPFLLCSPEGYEKAEDLGSFRMHGDLLSAYLNGENTFDYSEFEKIGNYSTYEPKIGIGRDRYTNTSREGALYRVGMTRYEGKANRNTTSFWVNLNNLNLAEGDFIRLGAENKIARLSKTQKSIRVASPGKWETPNLFKLYLSTPAIFSHGVIPDWVNQDDDMRGTVPDIGVKVQLETCVVGRFLSFGGFDIKKYQPKPMMKAVPAGSVYYFRLLEEKDAENQINQLIQYFSRDRNPVSKIRSDEGLGRAFVGKQ